MMRINSLIPDSHASKREKRIRMIWSEFRRLLDLEQPGWQGKPLDQAAVDRAEARYMSAMG